MLSPSPWPATLKWAKVWRSTKQRVRTVAKYYAARAVPQSCVHSQSRRLRYEMPSKIISDCHENGLAFNDRTLPPVNSRFRSRSLSGDKLDAPDADRTAILDDVEAVSETPGCLVNNRPAQLTINGWVLSLFKVSVILKLMPTFKWATYITTYYKTICLCLFHA